MNESDITRLYDANKIDKSLNELLEMFKYFHKYLRDEVQCSSKFYYKYVVLEV